MCESRTTGYALKREVDLSYEAADRRIREELLAQGFGVLTVAEEARSRLETALDRVAPG